MDTWAPNETKTAEVQRSPSVYLAQDYFQVDALRLKRYDLETLTVISSYCRWSVICSTVEDWTALSHSIAGSKNANLQELTKVLDLEFLPYIPDLYKQVVSFLNCKIFKLNLIQVTEREKRLLQAAPRRASDRLEVKKLTEKEGESLLREKEEAERERQRLRDEERMKRNEANSREERAKLRERERARNQRMKAKAQEGTVA